MIPAIYVPTVWLSEAQAGTDIWLLREKTFSIVWCEFKDACNNIYLKLVTSCFVSDFMSLILIYHKDISWSIIAVPPKHSGLSLSITADSKSPAMTLETKPSLPF